MGSIGIIGGSDGPTAIFVTGTSWAGTEWFNTIGFLYVALILVPNIIYAWKRPGQDLKCSNMRMLLLEQIGRYGCMLLMITFFGLRGMVFSIPSGILAYYVLNPLLILAYWICWIPYFRRPRKGPALALAILPAAVFAVSGIALGWWPLILCAAVFGTGHIYVTMHNF